MITVHDVNTGEDHRGKTPNTIARRLYGRNAIVRTQERFGERRRLVVLTPQRSDRVVYLVRANWTV